MSKKMWQVEILDENGYVMSQRWFEDEHAGLAYCYNTPGKKTMYLREVE